MKPKPPNIVMVVVDSLRDDAVTASDDLGMPYIAAHARRFTRARSSGCWTLPSTASMFTGCLPHRHEATARRRRVRPDVRWLPEVLRDGGYRTVQITANTGTTGVFGLDRGFDRVRRMWEEVPPHFGRGVRMLTACARPSFRRRLLARDPVAEGFARDLHAVSMWLQSTAEAIFERALAELTAPPDQRPCFLFLNLMEAHFPYHVGPTFGWLATRPWARPAELKALGFLINQTFMIKEGAALRPAAQALLRRRQQVAWRRLRGPLDDFVHAIHSRGRCLAIVASDHGDNFGEQGWYYHFANVTDAGIRVPLFWLDAERADGARCDAPISTHLLYDAVRAAAGADQGPAALLEAPESTPSMTESFWYDNRGRTLARYRYNQFCFVEGDRRFVLRDARWLTAPVGDQGPEPVFAPLSPTTDPIEEAVRDATRRDGLRREVAEFKHYARQLDNRNAPVT